MIKEVRRLQAAIFCGVLIFLPAITHAQTDPSLRTQVMEEVLYAMETEAQSPLEVVSSANENFSEQNPSQIEDITEEENNFTQEEEIEEYIKSPILNNAYLTLGLELGYICGNTAYDFDHHTSELEFPMDNWMIGANLSSGLKNLSFNAEFWTPLEEDAGYNMKDKDWIDGILVSYSKSKAEMDAIICDVNLRYDFYKRVILEGLELLTLLPADDIKIGALLGYRYERFDFDMYDLHYDVDLLYGYQGQTLYQGQNVLTYKIKYYLPYLGLATDVSRKDWGISMNIKYSLYPTAKDVDNHLLRGLTFYGDYDKHRKAFMGSIFGFWKFAKDWKLKAGLDWALMRIDGRTWEAGHDPAWDKDQSSDTKHWICWSGVEYKF